MAATILTSTPYSAHQNGIVTAQYDISSHPSTDQSWDEQIVPALRKRLEEESRHLGKRISRMEADDFAFKQSTSKGRAGRRTEFSNEIIQDGLGSDDLIPSEWVTGSSAQFHTFTPKSRTIHSDEGIRRSASGSHYAHFSPDHQSQKEASLSFPIEFHDDIARARERARQIAMGKGQDMPGSPVSRGAIEQHHSDEEEQEEVIDCTSMGGERSHLRARTSSALNSPSRAEVRDDKETEAPGHFPAYSRERSPSLRSNSSMQEKGSSPSRIPILASGSLSNVQQSSQSKNVRKMRSVGTMPPSSTSPAQNHKEEAAVRMPSRKTEQSKKKATLGNGAKARYPSEKAVNDEFGPLGGSPRQKGLEEWRHGETDNVSTRSLSNPWDEEMLPTIKRKLEQQRMLDELSRDDDLVDTWDRHGMPVSKSPVSLRHRARSDSMNKVPGQTSSPVKSDEADRTKESMHVVESVNRGEQAQRMQRLHDQLSAGLQVKEDEAIPMAEKSGAKILHERTPPPPLNALPEHCATSTKRKETSKEPQSDSARREEEAGCCNCTVM